MIIAHMPAGYLLMKAISHRFEPARAKALWACGLLASVLPDIDILYFYAVKFLNGNSPTNHRFFFTHWPLFWLVLLGGAALALIFLKKRHLVAYPLVTLAGVSLHLVLDILGAPIFYLAPFSWEPVQLVTVPSVYSWWLMNFLRHWIFLVELGICGLAAVTWLVGLWLRWKNSDWEEEDFETGQSRTLARVRTLNRPLTVGNPEIYSVSGKKWRY